MARSLEHYWKLLRWGLHYYRAEHDVTIETGNGRLNVSSKDWLIGKQLFIRGDYELDFIKTTIGFLEDEGLLSPTTKKTVVDIGANLGMICIALLRENIFDKAIAFEPGPRNFELLEKNVELNGLSDHINCFPAALSSENGQVEFEIAADNSGDSRVRKTSETGEMGEQNRPSLNVAATTFDSFLHINQVDVNDIDMLWIDIQGHEGHFFRGASEFFRNRKIPVVNEFWGYGIGRSGMSRTEYCDVIENTFSKFYQLTENGYESQPISEIARLFENYSKPRQIANIILI